MTMNCFDFSVARRICVCCFFILLPYAGHSADTYALSVKGANELKNGNLDSAIKIFSQIVETETNNAYAYYSRGTAFCGKRQFDKSIEDLTAAIRLSSANAPSSNNFVLCYSLFSRGNAYYSMGDDSKAIDDYNRSIQGYPALPEAYINRAKAFFDTSQYDRSITDCNVALALNPNHVGAYVQRGDAYRNIGKFDRALSDYSNAIRLDPNNDLFYIARAKVFIDQTNYQNALIDYSKIIQLAPSNASAYAIRGILYSKVGEYAKGLDDCKTALKLDTGSAMVYNNLAWLLATVPDESQRDEVKALEYAKTACDLSSWKDSSFLGTYAAAAAETGNFDDAVTWQQKSIDLGLQGEQLKEALERLSLYKSHKPYHLN